MPDITRALLFGYHGKRNVGDDSICVSLIETLIKLVDSKKVAFYVYVKDNYIEENSAVLGSQIYYISSTVGLLKALAISKIVIVDGGDHLSDYGGLLKNLKVFMLFLGLAIATKLTFKTFLIINGGFRVTTSIGLAFLKITLSLATCVSVRDKYSHLLASRLVSKQLGKGFDTAVLFNYVKEAAAIVSIRPLKLDTSRQSIDISVTPVFANFFSKPEKDEALARAIAKSIGHLFNNVKNVDVFLLAFNTDSRVGDLGLIERIVQVLDPAFREHVKIVAYVGTVHDFLSRLSQLDFMVCCKYHSVLFSYLLEKPALVINYHPKNAALVHEVALPERCLLSLEDVIDGRLGLMLCELLKNPEEFRAELPIHEAKWRALSAIQRCVVHAF